MTDYANDPSIKYHSITTDKLVTNPQDFTHFYEPTIGSEKIVEGITKIVNK